jgi:tetratricopeptide (TPR) repeat protein
MSRLRDYGVPLLVLLISISVIWLVWPRTHLEAARPPLPIMVGTSRADLDAAEAEVRLCLARDDSDVAAGVRLAEILLRKARIESDAVHAIEAERVLKAVLEHEPGEYSALKRLGAVYLSQHRFQQAADLAARAIAVDPQDAWNYGVLGDASVELGRYEDGFAAFDTMVRLRPDAASYARVAYAHELQGRLDAALRHMRMALEATSAHDPESLAWHHAQVGSLLFQMGRLDEAAREFAQAHHVFPNHPYARAGQARVAAARGDYAGALSLYRGLMAESPTPELAATIGDLLAQTGDAPGAGAMYAQAESLEREGWEMEEPQPAALARMLAERGRKIDEAVRLAEQAARSRSDIVTMDTLAWAYYQTGRLEEARAASSQALRTGTSDKRIHCHAAAIDRAVNGRGSASVNRAQCRFEQWVTEFEAE